YLGEAGEDIPSEAAPSDGETTEEPTAPAPRTAEVSPEPETVVARTAEQSERIKASPLARRIARERGIDLAGLAGTGPEGRIVAEDVERAAVAPAPAAAATGAPAAQPGEAERVELTSLRRTIARRLTEAWTVPAFQISMS